MEVYSFGVKSKDVCKPSISRHMYIQASHIHIVRIYTQNQMKSNSKKLMDLLYFGMNVLVRVVH